MQTLTQLSIYNGINFIEYPEMPNKMLQQNKFFETEGGESPAFELDFSSENYRAIHYACEVAGQLSEKWGFKRALASTWTFLFLCPEPACAKDICKALNISPALVSITIQELLKNHLVRKQFTGNRRRDYYVVETGFLKMLHILASKAPSANSGVDAHELNLALEILDRETQFRPDLRSRRTCQFQKVRIEELKRAVSTLDHAIN